MIVKRNPFYFKVLPLDYPFCDRLKELKDLIAYAQNYANVLIYSPRRFGKTSLVKRVQNEVSKRGAITAFTDFFGVTSVDDVASRFARSIYEVTHKEEGLFKSAIKFLKTFRPVLKPDESGSVSLMVEPITTRKSGFELLDETISSIGEFIGKTDRLVNIALDEFQEIIELTDASKIEGILRRHIQEHRASYFFIGSRRNILLTMFNDKKRPFFQSAINYQIDVLPLDELTDFIREQFESNGKRCSKASAELISTSAKQHPYYSQKLAFFTYEEADSEVTPEVIKKGFTNLLESEKPVFEAIIQGLAPRQIALLNAIAGEPSGAIFSIDYMKNHNLGSIGGIQGAVKRLVALDLIENNPSGSWSIVDPMFEWYLFGNHSIALDSHLHGND